MTPVYPAAGGGVFTPDYPYKIVPAMTRWLMPGHAYSSTAAYEPVASDMIWWPIFVEQTTTYIRIACEVTVGAAGNARMGIYNWSGGLPSTLVLDAGLVDVTAIAVKEIVIAQELTRGYYFLAFVCDVLPTFRIPQSEKTLKCPVTGMFNSFARPSKIVLTRAACGAEVGGGLSDPSLVPNSAYRPDYCPYVLLREN